MAEPQQSPDSDSTGARGSGAFAKILDSQVLLHSRGEGGEGSVQEQLAGWGFDVRVQKSLAAVSVGIVAGAHQQNAPRIVLLEQPTLTTLEDLRTAISESGIEVSVIWVLVNPSPEAAVEVSRWGGSARLVEGVQSELFDAMVWAAAQLEGADGQLVSSEQPPTLEPSPSTAIRKSIPPGSSPRVLLVEDNEINRMVVEEILEDAPIALECAENGREAVDKVATGRFDLVFMDCQMPVLDGFAATREIRALEEAGVRCHPSGHIPIVALTANAIRGDQARCLAAGMDDYLTKPFDDSVLIEVIHRHLDTERTAARAAAEDSTDPESPAPQQAAGPAPFDAKECLHRCGNNLDLAKRLVGMLVDQGDREVPQIDHAIAAAQWSEARALCHGLRGAAGNLGAVALHEVLTQLEDRIREEPEPDRLSFLVDRLHEENTRFRTSNPTRQLESNQSPAGPRSPA